MKQYPEQLRKECSDPVVDRIIDLETDKPSKVFQKIYFYCIIFFKNLVVALFCSPSFYG
jgi:hypothetical protein